MADGSHLPFVAADEKHADGPDAVDLHVGARLRARRKSIGFSQERLATALGISFQQLQKYERGSNRISASKLWHAARALGCFPADLYAGLAELEAANVADPAGEGRREQLAAHASAVRDAALVLPEIALISGMRPAYRGAVRQVIIGLSTAE